MNILKALANLVLIVVAFAALILIWAGLDALLTPIADIAGPIFVLGGTAALAVFAFKKGK